MSPRSTERVLSEIGKRVRDARLKAGLSQQKAATATGSDFRYFQRLETGRINPTVATLARIADGLGLTFFDLICRPADGGAHERPAKAPRRAKQR